MIDVTDHLLTHFNQQSQKKTTLKQRHEVSISSHPQAALMFAKLAAHHMDEIGKVRHDFYDFSRAINFRALATSLSDHIDPNVEPSFDEPLRPDEQVKDLFRRQLTEELNRHQAACIEHGLRRCFYDLDSDRLYLRLGKRRRDSALYLLDVRAQLEALDGATGNLLNPGNASDDAVFFALASSAEHLRYITDADPKSWATFENAVSFTSENLTAYAAFLVFLEVTAVMARQSLWYEVPLLLELAAIFRAAFTCPGLTDSTLLRLMETFSLSPKESAEFLLPVPFFKLGRGYLRCHGYIKIMGPALGLLTIAIRKNEAAWSRTVGATLARAADVIAASLPKFRNIRVAVRRGIKGKGDVDLAIYDVNSRHILICEIKTVYDKHRTVTHMLRFENAKVNLARALKQIRHSIVLVESGAIDMKALFGQSLPPPLRISGALLTWLDPIDLTMGTDDDDLISLNFATFRYLFQKSEGDLAAMLRAILELRNIWCVAVNRPIDLQTEIPTDIEVQIPVVDALSDIEQLKLSPLAMTELRQFSSLPDEWRNMPEEAGELVTYLEDTRKALGIE